MKLSIRMALSCFMRSVKWPYLSRVKAAVAWPNFSSFVDVASLAVLFNRSQTFEKWGDFRIEKGNSPFTIFIKESTNRAKSGCRKALGNTIARIIYQRNFKCTIFINKTVIKISPISFSYLHHIPF